MIALGADHGGFALKEEIKKYLVEIGEKVEDCGPYHSESVDYPAYAKKVTDAVTEGSCSRGILICGTGIGMSIAANKVKGIRAALCSEPLSARLTREHNDSNVLCMGARVIGEEMAKEIVRTWISTPFSEGVRHIRRIEMLEGGDIAEFK